MLEDAGGKYEDLDRFFIKINDKENTMTNIAS